MLTLLLTACGQLDADTERSESDDRDGPEAESDGGAGRTAATVAPEASGGAGAGGARGDAGAGVSGAGFVHPCGFDYQQPPCGEWQVVTSPDGAEFPPDAAPCVIPLEFDLDDPNILLVMVECTAVLHCEEPEPECWAADDPHHPTAVVFNDALCDRVSREGLTVIDIMAGCTDPALE